MGVYMMIKMAFIALDKVGKESYVEDLTAIFSDYIEFSSYSIEEGISGKINEKTVIITDTVIISLIQFVLEKDANIIILNRTFSDNSLQELRNLEVGTEVLLANNCNSAAMDTISSLYKIGVNHLNFHPYCPGMEITQLIEGINIVITPGKLACVPPHAKRIINLGTRKIDISTLLDIVAMLGVMDENLKYRIFEYSNEIVGINPGMLDMLQNVNKTRSTLNNLLDMIEDGVIVVDKDNVVINYNKRILETLNIDRKKIYKFRLGEILPADIVDYKDILETHEFDNLVIESESLGRIFSVNKKKIRVYNCDYGFILIFTKPEGILGENDNQSSKQSKKQTHIAKYNFSDLIGVSNCWQDTITKAKKMAKSGGTVLITGESGTGKELFAQSIHNHSNRADKPFVAFNCAALSPELLESELFGYEEGAFTGAKKGGKTGLFECAHTGTIFLDEIGDMPLALQAKMLRTLEQKEIMPVGGTSVKRIDVRIIAATNKNFETLIEEELFRKDLFYRLNVFNLFISPLRERTEDIIPLSVHFLHELGYGDKILDEDLKNILIKYRWDGNIRELRNCIQYMAYMGGDILTTKDLPPKLLEVSKGDSSFQESTANEDFVEGLRFLTSRERAVAVEILEVLKMRSAGRRTLLDILNSNGIAISEHELRRIMNYLKKLNLIAYGKGREGARII